MLPEATSNTTEYDRREEGSHAFHAKLEVCGAFCTALEKVNNTTPGGRDGVYDRGDGSGSSNSFGIHTYLSWSPGIKEQYVIFIVY